MVNKRDTAEQKTRKAIKETGEVVEGVAKGIAKETASAAKEVKKAAGNLVKKINRKKS